MFITPEGKEIFVVDGHTHFWDASPENQANIHGKQFIDGPDDIAILNSTYLKDFYKNGFNSIERNASVAQKYPNRFIVNGPFDPRDGEKALE